MKKLLLSFLICLLISFPIVSQAEINETARTFINQMDDATLVEYRDMINQSLIDRGVEINTDFSQGVYFVGKDIKPGSYLFTFEVSRAGIIVETFDSKEKYDDHKPSYHVRVDGPDVSSISLNLEEGNVLYLEDYNGTTKIKISTVKPAWAP